MLEIRKQVKQEQGNSAFSVSLNESVKLRYSEGDPTSNKSITQHPPVRGTTYEDAAGFDSWLA